MGNCIIVKSASTDGTVFYDNTAATGSTTIINADQLDGHPSSYFLNTSSRLLTIDDIYPVGSIYLTASSTNPTTLFGGTWVQISQGRTLIGAGTGTDVNNTSQTFTAGSTGGEYTHTLTVDELASHGHSVPYIRHWSWNDGGSNPGNLGDVSNGGYGSYSLTASNTGGGQAHNNIQPYLVVNIWQRTA